jgi:hypothetical protein
MGAFIDIDHILGLGLEINYNSTIVYGPAAVPAPNATTFPCQGPESILFITLDSCRYDTFAAANVPNMKSVGTLYRAMAPGNFTYGSHAAMFVGFTPGVADYRQAYVNPKYGKIFKMTSSGFPGKGSEFMTLSGPNIIHGLRRKGYLTLGTGAVGWFDPNTETGQHLTKDFDAFYYPGGYSVLGGQLNWLADRLAGTDGPNFVFLNIGETHVPYVHEGADWNSEYNPCIPTRISAGSGKRLVSNT